MARWSYDMPVPNDAPEVELERYRDLAISTWRTAVEASGARPGVPQAQLETLTDVEPIRDRLTGELVAGASRRWHVEGDGV